MEVVLDSSILVGILAPRDRWHQQATDLWLAVKESGHTPLYLDCVVSESVSVATRRLFEQNRSAEIETLFRRLENEFAVNTITWVLPDRAPAVPGNHRPAAQFWRRIELPRRLNCPGLPRAKYPGHRQLRRRF
jgi:predicted nucleic acid-binding protein